MNVNGKHYETIWTDPVNERIIRVIDQRCLPFRFEIKEISTSDEMAGAIADMVVRGAPLIGAAGAYGVYLAVIENEGKPAYRDMVIKSADRLKSARPTAVNLEYAVNRVLTEVLKCMDYAAAVEAARNEAGLICREEKEASRLIGEHGWRIIKDISDRKQNQIVNILTHCNAGWLACIDYGTALAPVYKAFGEGIRLHVWVDETRPRNQGARLTAWELGQQGVPHTIITDNTGGHLMQHGMVDMVITGSDRTTANGDVANKSGTYLKALAAADNHIPFYAALPLSTIDLRLHDGLTEIPIETRSQDEVRYIDGLLNGRIENLLLTPESSPALNIAFDVTPSRLVTALITEKGICKPDRESILALFSKRQKKMF